MSKAKYWRLRSNGQETLHRSTCSRLTRRHRMMGRAVAWPWADHITYQQLTSYVLYTDIVACHGCQPLTVRHTGVSTR